MPSFREMPPVGVLLAGGQGRRMGTLDKCLVALGGRPLMAIAIERLKPQAEALVISANGDPQRFDRFALPVVPDGVVGHLGPLAGILAGMRWAEKHVPASDRIVTVATDTPFFPTDLVSRLQAAAPTNRIAVACSNNRPHRVFGLFPVQYAGHLDRFIKESKSRRVGDWLAEVDPIMVDFDDQRVPDPFFNINHPDDLTAAERILAGGNLKG